MNITEKYIQELRDLEDKSKENGLPDGVIYLNKAEDVLQRFEVALIKELETRRLKQTLY